MKRSMLFLLVCGALLTCVAPVAADEDRDFAGMAKVKVLYTDITDGDATVIVEFLAVDRAWKHNEAGDAKHLVGKKFLLMADDNRHQQAVKKVLATLKVGDVVVVDVEQEDEKTLELKELTEEQRKKI